VSQIRKQKRFGLSGDGNKYLGIKIEERVLTFSGLII